MYAKHPNDGEALSPLIVRSIAPLPPDHMERTVEAWRQAWGDGNVDDAASKAREKRKTKR